MNKLKLTLIFCIMFIFSISFISADQLFATVGDNGAVRWSEDGKTWTTTGTAGTTRLWGVAWSPELELFVAVGNAGAVRWSEDGKNWTTTGTAGLTSLFSVAWSPELELFAAVGDNAVVRWSEDGKTWTTTGTAGSGTEDLYGVAWSPELELFAAVGNNGAVRWSEDGKNWTTTTAGTTELFSVAWSPELELFAAVGNAGAVRWSENGKSWTLTTAGTTRLWGVAWSPELELFAAVGDNGAVRWSENGKSWTLTTAGTTRLRAVAWSPELELFAAVGNAGAVRWSEDGKNWTTTGTAGLTSPYGVAWKTKPIMTNFTITAKDIHTNNTINNFSVIIDSITYNTTNGTITTHILKNSTSLWDINISSDGYFNRTYINYNVSSNLEAELTPYNITIYSPENNTEVAENFNASFKVFTDGTINKCELLINEVVNQTINNLDNETTYNFILEFNPGEDVEFNWSIKCDINSKEFITANRNYKFRSLLMINLYNERTYQFINESISFLFRSSTYEWNQTTTNGTITLYGNEGLPMGVYEIIMSSVNYYPRSYYVDISTISQTINLYLLLRNESSTHTFFVKNLQDRVLDNISIEFMKMINLTWLPVTQKFTDFSGAILVNLDPLVRYKITFQDPSGEYLPKEAYIEPIFSTYTIFLNYNQSSYFETVWDSVSYYISQTNTSLNPIETEFKLTVISTTGNILFFGLSAEINGTTYINNITGSPGGGSAIINLPLDEEENKNINVKYWIKTSNPHYLELSKTHSIINLTAYEGEYSLVKIQQPFRDELSPRMRILLASFFIIVVVSFATLFIRKSYSVLVGVPLLIIFAIPIIGWIPIWLATFQSIMLIGFFVVFGEWS